MTLPVSVGLGWRPETAWLIDCRPRAAFSEVIAENIDPKRPPRALAAAIERGLVVVAHGISLSLGGARPPDRARVKRLAAVAKTLRSPVVSEHIAFARAGDITASHFLPVPRTRVQLATLVDHVQRLQDALAVPLALENVAAPLAWPGDELHEADFVAELIERTGALLLLDVANLHTNLVNHGADVARYLDRLPLDRIAYLHVAGGAWHHEMWRDTHAHPIASPALSLLTDVLARSGRRPILLERDRHFDKRGELEAELDTLEAILAAAPTAPRPVVSPTLLPLPSIDRDQLEHAHRDLLISLVDPRIAPPAGFAPHHIAEARAILDEKRARSHTRPQ